jgi:glutamate racemase
MPTLKPSRACIAVYDSGFGGLTILQALQDLIPDATYYYLGDAARMPYGTKSKETISRYALECGTFLQNLGADILVVACHTVSAVGVETLKNHLTIPVFGVVDPCIEALKTTRALGPVAILATSATIQSTIYQRALTSIYHSDDIITVACPLLAPLVEEGLVGTDLAKACVSHYLQPLKSRNISHAVLACTHYPLLLQEIQNALGDSCSLINPALHCAVTIKDFITRQPQLTKPLHLPHRFFTTDDPNKFEKLSPCFLKQGVTGAEKVII